MEAGKTYGMTIRRKDGSSVVRAVTTKPGWQTQVVIAGAGAEVGALFMFGYPNQQTSVMRIMAIRPGEDLSAELELVDDAPGIQNADTGPITGDPGTVFPPPPLADYRPFGLSAKQFLDTNNGITSQITRIFWQIPAGAPQMSGFLIVAVDEDGQEFRTSTPDGNTFSIDYLNLPTSDYTILVQGFTADGRYTGFSDPFHLSQLLPDTEIGVEFDRLQDELSDAFAKFREESQAELDEKVAAFEGQFADLANQAVGAKIAEEKTERVSVDETLGQRITTVQAVADDAGARVTGETTARINGEGALGQRVDQVLAIANGTAAGLQTEQTTRASQNSALAQQISTAIAQTSLATASGYYKLEAISNGANGHSRFLIWMNAGTPANPRWASSGFVLEAWIENNQPRSRCMIVAQQFAVSNDGGPNEIIPFIIDGGVVYINNAYIRNLNVNNLAINGVQFENILEGATANAVVVTAAAYDVSTYFTVRGGTVVVMCRGANSSPEDVIRYGVYRNGQRISGLSVPRATGGTVTGVNIVADFPGNGTFLYEFKNEGYYYLSSPTLYIHNVRK